MLTQVFAVLKYSKSITAIIGPILCTVLVQATSVSKDRLRQQLLKRGCEVLGGKERLPKSGHHAPYVATSAG